MIQKQESTNQIQQKQPHLSDLGVGTIVIGKLTPMHTRLIATRSKQIIETFKMVGITSEERDAFFRDLLKD